MKKSCAMYISLLHYNKKGERKVAVCIYYHFIITRKDEEKLRYVYIITSLQQGRIKKSCGMYISSLHHNKKGWKKVELCIYHSFITTKKEKEKLRYEYIITSLQQGRMKKSCSMYISSHHYNKEGWRKVAVCIYHHFITTRKDEEKLQYVYIITSLQQGRIKKSCGMYISSLHYNKEAWRKVALCIYYYFSITWKDEEKLRYVYIVTSL